MSLFGSMVAVAFQSVFHSEIYQNNIFFIFKKLFLIWAYQTDLKTLKNINLKQIKKYKKFNFFLKYFWNEKNK